MKKQYLVTLLILVAILASALPLMAQNDEVVELRMTYYTDGNEDVVMQDLLDRFEADNPDIHVVMDVVAYSAILENLPIQLGAGEGPDIARVTNLGGLSQYYLDLRPYLDDEELGLSGSEYWEENFGPFLQWLRPSEDDEGIYGYHMQLTVTGPYINRTLFEQAGVDVPSDSMDRVTWADWAEATRQVAEATDTPYAMAMDRTGHRFAGPAISSGAQYFDEDGHPALLGDEGFRAFAEQFLSWHEDGTMPLDVWAGQTGYAAANEEFANGQVVLYMSGNWQIAQFANTIGDDFDWEAVPNPCGPAEDDPCTGMPGGAALVAIDRGEDSHPAEVARVMDYLVQQDVFAEFAGRTLFIPAHAAVAAAGVEFDTDLPQAEKTLSVFTDQVAVLDPLAFRLQAYVYNRAIFDATRDRLTQAILGELTLDEAIERIQDDVDAALEAAGAG